MTTTTTQRGYSLAEALVVIAIVGLISVITVPQFIAMSHGMKLSSSLRQFTSDIRSARARAITRDRYAKVSFSSGVGNLTYHLYEGTIDPATGNIVWNATPWVTRNLQQSTYFVDPAAAAPASVCTDIDTPADGDYDIVFNPTGVLRNATVCNQIVLRSQFTDVAHRYYTINISVPGNLTTK